MTAKIVDAVASITIDIEGRRGTVLVRKGKADLYVGDCPGLPGLHMTDPSFVQLVQDIPECVEVLVRLQREDGTRGA